MITISHDRNYEYPNVDADEGYEITAFGYGYLCGLRPPRYPVPAPIHPVAWDMFDWLWIHGYISTEMWNTISLWELTRS